MRSTPFHKDTDLAPMPFGRDHRLAAKRLKEEGLLWRPQVGCFVWDEMAVIEVPSPFPDRIYFILNLGHFLRGFGTVENMVDKLVWLPTWHQARLICQGMGIDSPEIREALCSAGVENVDHELLLIYNLILERLEEQQRKEVDA
jgi:hypothetical protein